MLEVKDLSKKYDQQWVLRGVQLTVPEGEFFSILGPSGCGKTTLLRLLAGFEVPTVGEVWQAGVRIDRLPPHQRQFNTVFQRYALFPHLNVWENVAFGLRMKKVSSKEIGQRVLEALALTQMESFSKRSIATLSGGQQQRVALARAIVNRPKILLLDEPLSALDLKLRRQMQVELLALQRRLKHTFIFVTHDQEEALTLSDRIAVMNSGKIEQVGTSHEIYENPKTQFVAEFIGSMNCFEARVREVRADEVVLDGVGKKPIVARLPKEDSRHLFDFAPSSLARLMVRPERLKILKSQPVQEANCLEGALKEVLYQGALTRFLVTSKEGTHTWIVDQPNRAAFSKKAFQLGDRVFISWASEDGVLLSTSGRGD
jgi:spermidine/putrescine transport system ATP-binding protein